MKSTAVAFGALSLLHMVAGQPHRAHHVHQNMHVKKDVVVTVIDTVYAQPTNAPRVVVIVNQFGDVLSTITEGGNEKDPKAWSTAHGANVAVPSAAPSTVAAVVAPEPIAAAPAILPSVVSVATSVAVSPAPVASSPPAESDSSSSPSSKGDGFGFAYSPYMANGNCKTQEQVNEDFEKIGSGYSLVRTYGTDCNQTATVLTSAKAHGLKLFAGIFDLSDLPGQVALIVDAARNDWASIDTVSVGNELVNSGAASPSQVVAAIGQVRSLLKTAGYSGKVVTVDTLVAARANPSLCDASDVCTVNCHPFYDGKVEAKGAGDFLTTQIPTLRNVLANKDQEIVISETGWPWKGDNNKVAVPSTSNQADAINSIKSAFASSPKSIILFTTFNDMWKKNSASQFEAEQFWGFLGDAPSG